jgi:membrane-bound serine protease (ClpP class)
MVGSEAEVIKDIDDEGEVFLKGEYWRATSEMSIKKGAKVRVVKVEGLSLIVEEIIK